MEWGSSQHIDVDRAPPDARPMTNTDELLFAFSHEPVRTRVGRRETFELLDRFVDPGTMIDTATTTRSGTPDASGDKRTRDRGLVVARLSRTGSLLGN